jgi:uncharacterized membrane protein
MTKLNKALSIFLILAILLTSGFIVYMVATPKKGEKFTEFYILNTEGKIQDYPEQVSLGTPVEILVGIVNHEYRLASYRVDIKMDSIEIDEINTGTLVHQQKWEEKISFTPQVVGERQRVDFYLYKNSETESYLKEPLRLYINVISP